MKLANPRKIYRNLSTAQLVETALARGEGILASNGALVVTNGKYTGRSPNDKFIVDLPSVHDKINWGPVNQPMVRSLSVNLNDYASLSSTMLKKRGKRQANQPAA